jgi:hypothetical protein
MRSKSLRRMGSIMPSQIILPKSYYIGAVMPLAGAGDPVLVSSIGGSELEQ